MSPKEIVLYIHALLTKHDVRFLLDCGQLLIAYRDGKVNDLNKADDFDFGIDREDLDKVKTLILNDPLLSKISKVKKIWLNEISIKFGEFQVDFYTYDYDEYFFYNYWYAPNPNDNGQWTLGYRIKFPKEVYMPFKDFRFLGVNWKICAEPERKFSLHYGDWKTDKPGVFMGIHNIPCVDPEYRSDEKGQ